MPSRWVILCIVAFWLVATGWLFWRDVWPQVRPGEPPPFAVDLTEETQLAHPRIRWKVFQGDDGRFVERFYAQTWVTYRESDDTFALVGEFKPSDPTTRGTLTLGRLTLERINSLSRVTRSGDLRETRVAVTLHNLAIPGTADYQPRFRLNGVVRDGLLHPTLRFELIDAKDKPAAEEGVIDDAAVKVPMNRSDFDPVPVPPNGALLQPLQPVNRIRGLRTGRTWRVPLIDPLAAALPSPFKAAQYLNATVLDRIELVPYEGLDRPCYVIDYEGEEAHARTWVEAGPENRVLRQEATFGGETLRLVRDSTRGSVRSAP